MIPFQVALHWLLATGCRRWPLRLREQHSKRRPGAWSRLYFNLAVMHLYDAIHHREADPASLFLRREIEVEDALQMLRRNADAGIDERHRYPTARGAVTHHAARAAFGHRRPRI